MDGWGNRESVEDGFLFHPKKLGSSILSFNVTIEDFIIVREKRFTDLGEI